jgi:hypothetical protein
MTAQRALERDARAPRRAGTARFATLEARARQAQRGSMTIASGFIDGASKCTMKHIVDASDDPLHRARARLDELLATLEAKRADHALLPAARNAIECLGGLARFGASVRDMYDAVDHTVNVLTPLLDRDPGDALCAPLLEQRAIDLSAIVAEVGDLSQLAPDDQESWSEAATETLGMRDSADAWLLGAAAILRRLEPSVEREHFERARERTVASVSRFDAALKPAIAGLTRLRDTARAALMRARGDKGYARRAWYWRTLAEG